MPPLLPGVKTDTPNIEMNMVVSSKVEDRSASRSILGYDTKDIPNRNIYSMLFIKIYS